MTDPNNNEDISKQELLAEIQTLKDRVNLNELRAELNRRAIVDVGHKVKDSAAIAGRSMAKVAILTALAVVSPKDMLNKLYDQVDGSASNPDEESNET